VDELVPRSRFDEQVMGRAREFAAKTDRPAENGGIDLAHLFRAVDTHSIAYTNLTIDIDRDLGAAYFTVQGPREEPPQDPGGIQDAGCAFWPLALARELDDAIMHLRLNEGEIGTWVFRSAGDNALVQLADQALLANAGHWLVREIILYLKRTLKRLDVSSRSLIALIEPGSCFSGTLLELVLAADRSYMLDGTWEGGTGGEESPAALRLNGMNFGPLPMVNGLTRLQRRLLFLPEGVEKLKEETGRDLAAREAEELGLVTFIPDDIDWEEEVRLAIEERRSFSPDALTGLEASLRFGGPETMESKIFGRLSAWQNWIFQRPNAAGDQGALKLYGSGKKSVFDRQRI